MAEKRSSAFFDSLYWGLLSHGEPKILAGPRDSQDLSARFKMEGPEALRYILEKRAKELVKFWMRKLGETPRRRGRPQKHDPYLFHLLGVYKRKSGLSWSKLAKLVNRNNFKETPTAYNVQQAVTRAERIVKASKRRSGP